METLTETLTETGVINTARRPGWMNMNIWIAPAGSQVTGRNASVLAHLLSTRQYIRWDPYQYLSTGKVQAGRQVFPPLPLLQQEQTLYRMLAELRCSASRRAHSISSNSTTSNNIRQAMVLWDWHDLG
jgi:hypothetical protein